jgi:hypothetical protein
MADQVEITEPGVYDIPAEVYHADPVPGGSLSSSGARRLLPPSCPAVFRYEQEHGRTPKREFDLGHAAHRLVLGDGNGPDLVVIDADNYRTKAAQARRDEAHARGAVPLLTAEHEQVAAMARAILEHPLAAALFNPDTGGHPERSLFWRDEPTGVMMRARLDWLPRWSGSGRLIVPDYKTTKSAEPDAIQRAIYDRGYHMQGVWYLSGVTALGLAGEQPPVFVFVFQEKTPPYVVTVAQLDVRAIQIGQALNRRALQVYAECSASGRWPGYADDVVTVSLPGWAVNRYLDELEIA